MRKDAAATADAAADDDDDDDDDDYDDVYSHEDISPPSDGLGGRDETFRPPMMFLVEVLGRWGTLREQTKYM